MKKIFLFLYLSAAVSAAVHSQNIDLSKEYAMDEFKKGIKSYHFGQYEQAINFFLKALGYKSDHNLAAYFLGESYRKAGYEKNAIFVWNNLLSMGFNDKNLKYKILSLYNKRGLLSEININKNFLIRNDLAGYIDDKTPPVFLKPAQIYIDKNNHYFVTSFLTNVIVELDQNLNIVRNHFPIGVKLEKPFGVAVDKEGFIYVSDFKNDTVIKFDRTGIINKKIGYKGINAGGFLGPEYLLLDDEQNLYVTDSGNHKINKYKNNGDFLFSFGNDKKSETILAKPAGLFYSGQKIYVCDKELNKVFVYDKNGNLLNTFGENVLKSPYQMTIDKYNRYIIVCEKEIWIYEEENDLWYIMDALGSRLSKAVSIVSDSEDNILLTDFDKSKIIVLSHERDRYTNLNVNIERMYSYRFPDVFFSLTVEKDDFTGLSGITSSNISIFENGKAVPLSNTSLTEQYNQNTDILLIYDKNTDMKPYQKDVKLLIDNWFKLKNEKTNIALVSVKDSEAVLENDFDSTRLSVLDSIDKSDYGTSSDKGSAVKFGIYHMLSRFSKKALIIITNSKETLNDFNNFKLENCIDIAKNNYIPVYIVSFSDGGLSEIYQYIAKRTEGGYFRVYKSQELHNLVKTIENKKSREIIVSYQSKTVSRFDNEPITITVEINYSNMKGTGKTIYYPSR